MAATRTRKYLFATQSFLLDAPFDAAPRKLVELPLRLKHITWSSNRLAIVEETRWRDRKRIILGVSPAATSAPVKWFEGSFEDRYHDPGTPFTVMNAAGKDVAQTTPDASAVYFHGMGASAEGDRPFVSTIRVTNGEAKQHLALRRPVFCDGPRRCSTPRGPMLLIERESPELSPELLRDGSRTQFLGSSHVLSQSIRQPRRFRTRQS